MIVELHIWTNHKNSRSYEFYISAPHWHHHSTNFIPFGDWNHGIEWDLRHCLPDNYLSNITILLFMMSPIGMELLVPYVILLYMSNISGITTIREYQWSDQIRVSHTEIYTIRGGLHILPNYLSFIKLNEGVHTTHYYLEPACAYQVNKFIRPFLFCSLGLSEIIMS